MISTHARWFLRSPDSTVLADILVLLNKRYDYGLELFLLSIDEGIHGYRDDSLEVLLLLVDQTMPNGLWSELGQFLFVDHQLSPLPVTGSEAEPEGVPDSAQDSVVRRDLWLEHGQDREADWTQEHM